jgi:hypothetical protein
MDKRPIKKLGDDIDIIKTDIEVINCMLIEIKRETQFIKKYIIEKKEEEYNNSKSWFFSGVSS